jgi:hypothetical protein
MNWFAIAADATDQALSVMGEEFVYHGVTWRGVINQTDTHEILEVGGFATYCTCAILIQKRGFPTPIKGEKLTIGGKPLRIVRIADHPVSWTLYLEDVSR